MAHLDAKQFETEGFRFALLENLGTPSDPQLYTHNVNLGGIYFQLLTAMGIESVAVKQLLVLPIFALGLLYVFLSVRLVSGDARLAIVTLLLFCTAYVPVLGFSTNPLRAWHYVALFGTVYHLYSMIRGRQNSLSWGHGAGLMFSALVAFGCGYDFWVVCGAIAVMVVLLELATDMSWYARARWLGLIALFFTAPFAVRQLQIIAAMGFAYWQQDLLYSVAIKIPGANQLFDLPPLEDVDRFYLEHHAFRPPASPGASLAQNFGTASDMIEWITVPRWGIVSLLIFLVMTVQGAALRLLPERFRFRPPEPVASTLTRLLLPVTLGAFIGLLVFAPFSLHVYFKHEFPLIAAPILIANGAAIFWLLCVVLRNRRWPLRASAAVLLILCLFNWAIVQARGARAASYPNIDWIDFVTKRPEARFLHSGYAPLGTDAVLGVSDASWTVLQPPKAAAFAARLNGSNQGEAPPDPSQFDYWIYQPWAYLTNFDSSRPTCQRRDWLTGALFKPSNAWQRPPVSPLPVSPVPDAAGPGSIISVVVRNLWDLPAGAEIEVAPWGTLSKESAAPPQGTPPAPELQKRLVVDTAYNCIYGSLYFWLNIEPQTDGVAVADLLLKLPSGERITLGRAVVKIARGLPVVNPPVLPVPPPRLPTIAEMKALVPQLPVLDPSRRSGVGYVIFDLRRAGRTPSSSPGGGP